MTDAEREYLFLITLGRAPESRSKRPDAREFWFQRLLDKFSPAPALIKLATWDVLAWNKAATVIWPNLDKMGDTGAMYYG